VSLARRRAEINRRFAAVATDLEQGAIDRDVTRGPIQGEAFGGRHESTRRFGQREEHVVHAQTDSVATAIAVSGL